nr:RNA-dependent DNA polymerase [Deltaproteobacteria bacterium]
NIIEPIIGKAFIHDTYACIKDRGTHKAVQRYKNFQKKNNYVLKCDIKKYFFNIDHEILFDQVKRKIKCKDTLWLVRQIINSRENPGGIEYFSGDDLFTPVLRKKGIPIGNLTSQFFANLYLNDFDHFVKETLKVKHFIRYCDDFVIFGNSKSWLNQIKQEVMKYLEGLRLKLHKNKSRIYRTSDGVDFLGYRIFPGYMRVRKRLVKRYRKKLRKMTLDYKNRKIGLPDIKRSINSWIGHAKHADSYILRNEMFSKAVFQV